MYRTQHSILTPSPFPVAAQTRQQDPEPAVEPMEVQTRLTGPLLTGRHIRPAAPRAVSFAQTSAPGNHPSGGCDNPPITAETIRQTAAATAAAGPARLFGEQGMHSEQLNQRLLGHLFTHTPVDDCELLLHMLEHKVSFQYRPDMIQVTDEELTQALLQHDSRMRLFAGQFLPQKVLHRLMAHPTLAKEFVRQNSVHIHKAPPNMQTAAEIAPMMVGMHKDQRDAFLMGIIPRNLELALSLVPPQDIVRIHSSSLLHILPTVERREWMGLCKEAVRHDSQLLEPLKNILSDCEYQELCDWALSCSGQALEHMDDSDRTAERVDRAVARWRAPVIGAIPRSLLTGERLRLALKNSSGAQYDTTQSLESAFFTQWGLWDQLKQGQQWLNYLLPAERTEALCLEYLTQNPARLHDYAIPTAIKKQHPEWEDALWQPGLYTPLNQCSFLPDRRVHAARVAALCEATASTMRGAGQKLATDYQQPWALLLAGAWNELPPGYKAMIWRNGGTAGLGEAFGAPACRIAPQALLDPVQENHCTNRATWLPGEVAKKLMFCQPFRPRHAQLGAQLHQQMVEQGKELQRDIERGTLEVITPTGTWTQKGGRTLVQSQRDGGCLHMKFQRQGESLDSFAAEQAVQSFAQAHKEPGKRDTLVWHSEIPQPQGIQLVPLAALPVPPEQFPDTLEIHYYQGHPYALAFQFTTRDDSYDTLAWQPDTPQGGCERARQGLLRAFHDLGVWSSLGAVHTSTIALYHHFYETGNSRPELLLSEFFKPGACYPGTLHLWNSRATDQSDWGDSGLRDLGDLEFYPFIRTYTTSVDAQAMIPDYGQRASFVNAIAQNMFGGLLHYMRLHRATDPNYHYKNNKAVPELAQFIEQACDTFLDGLLGNSVRLKDLFAESLNGDSTVYPEWLALTAREIIYWSARQTQDGDGFAQHLNQDGRPCAELYPGHPWQNIRYGEGEQDDYTEAAGESLGTENGKLPLFYLVRGLYVLAAGLADRLSESEQPPMDS